MTSESVHLIRDQLAAIKSAQWSLVYADDARFIEPRMLEAAK